MTKAMKEALAKNEMKNDGHDLERFQKMLKTVVSVSKEDVKKREALKKAAKRGKK